MKKRLQVLQLRQKAVTITMKCFNVTKDIQKHDEKLFNKINDTSLAIPSLISQGVMVKSQQDYPNQLDKAGTLLANLETYLKWAHTLELLETLKFNDVVKEIKILREWVNDVKSAREIEKIAKENTIKETKQAV